MVARQGIPVVDTPIATIGGGLGSFAFVDTLRIAGVPANAISVLADGDLPERTYRYLATNSQIPDVERLRSDAGSTIDNIWGFPSYAFREAASARGLGPRLAPLWSVFSEPFGADYYTPRAGDVYRSVTRESERIGWSSMRRRGAVRVVRRRSGGGYFSILTPPPAEGGPKRVAYRSRVAHLAVGYPGVKFLPDLQAYRERHRELQSRGQRLRTPRTRLPGTAASTQCRDGSRQRHRGLPDPAASPRRSGIQRCPDHGSPPVPQLRGRPAGRLDHLPPSRRPTGGPTRPSTFRKRHGAANSRSDSKVSTARAAWPC